MFRFKDRLDAVVSCVAEYAARHRAVLALLLVVGAMLLAASAAQAQTSLFTPPEELEPAAVISTVVNGAKAYLSYGFAAIAAIVIICALFAALTRKSASGLKKG